VAADAVQVDPMLETTVPGLSAAGDLSSQMPSVANAVAAGSNAAAAIVRSLVT
jgi:thioredoxin reductase